MRQKYKITNFFRVEAPSGETAYTSYTLYVLLRQTVSTAAHNFNFYPKIMKMVLKYRCQICIGNCFRSFSSVTLS
jgi:hypothetical protein